MTRRKPKPHPATRLGLPEALAHGNARDLVEQIKAAQGVDLTLDASAVAHLGAQCAQVLLAARQSWTAEGRAFAIVDASPSFLDGARLLGLADHLPG